MENLNKKDWVLERIHSRARASALWFGVVFAAQIFMIILWMVGEHTEGVFQTLRYLYGDGYGRNKLRLMEQYMWMLNVSLYGLTVVRKAVQFRDENSYISMARYRTFRKYYLSSYVTLLWFVVLYEIAVFAGGLSGYEIVRQFFCVLQISWRDFLLSQVLMLVGNLFWSSILFFCVVHCNRTKWAIVLYPGIPVMSLLLRPYFSTAVNNLLPGSWLMLARSELAVTGGFSIPIVCCLEMVLFLGMSVLNLRHWER